jgi:hypothetical protein
MVQIAAICDIYQAEVRMLELANLDTPLCKGNDSLDVTWKTWKEMRPAKGKQDIAPLRLKGMVHVADTRCRQHILDTFPDGAVWSASVSSSRAKVLEIHRKVSDCLELFIRPYPLSPLVLIALI